MVLFFLQYLSLRILSLQFVFYDIIKYERGDSMPKLSSHIAHIISSFYHTLLELHAIPDFCLSRKKTGKVYLYKQESTSKVRKQTKIKAADEVDYLSLYEKRQKLKARLRELKSQYKTLSFKDRRDVRYALACFLHALDLGVGKVVEKNISRRHDSRLQE